VGSSRRGPCPPRSQEICGLLAEKGPASWLSAVERQCVDHVPSSLDVHLIHSRLRHDASRCSKYRWCHLRSLNVIAPTAVKLGWDQLGDSRKRTLHGRCARHIVCCSCACSTSRRLARARRKRAQSDTHPAVDIIGAEGIPLCTATLMHHTCVQQHPTRNPTPLTHPPPLPHKSPMHALSARQLLTRTFCAVATCWQEPCQSALLGSPRSSIARSSASTALPKRMIMTLHSYNHNHHHHLRRNYRYTHP